MKHRNARCYPPRAITEIVFESLKDVHGASLMVHGEERFKCGANRLECGHVVPIKHDTYGETNAYKRR